MSLFIFWLLLFFSAIFVVILQRNLIFSRDSAFQCQSLTKTRKLFHLLIVAVFSLGILKDKRFLFLCSFGIFILFALVEAVRFYRIGERVNRVLAENILIFLDEKDKNSKLILSHIYLLFGFSYPIWVSSFDRFNLADLSGLITVGIGDSFASLIGSKFGKHKFPGIVKFRIWKKRLRSQFNFYISLKIKIRKNQLKAHSAFCSRNSFSI